MRHCVLEDSSFVIAVMDVEDRFHRDAVYVFKKILLYKDEVVVIVPSIVFFESIVTLIKKGVPKDQVEDKFWKFLHMDNVVNVPVIETMAFKLCRRLAKNPDFKMMKTSDFVIANVAMEYGAQILTFDKGMRKRVKPTHDQIYYCSGVGVEEGIFGDETAIFIEDMKKAIGLDIPF